MAVRFLDYTYLNDRYHQLDIDQAVDVKTFLPVVFSDFGVATIFGLRKIILDHVPVFAPKSSMKLDDYEQVDQNGQSYLDDNYFQYYRRNIQADYFQSNPMKAEYFRKSGFAKIVVTNDKNPQTERTKRFYNGDEHTQVLTDRFGYISINSQVSYIDDLTNRRRVPLNQVWLFLGKITAESFENIRQVEPIINESHVSLPVTIGNDLLVLYRDYNSENLPMWFNLTPQIKVEYDPETGIALDPNALFPYNTLLTTLKPSQKILAYSRLEESTGRQYAKWIPCFINYKFATARDFDSERGNQLAETNVEQRNYLVKNVPNSLGSKVFLNEPESIILTFQTFGKIAPYYCLERAFVMMKKWFYQFQNNLLDLSRFYNTKHNMIGGFVNQNLDMKIESYQYPEIVLQVNNCQGSYLPILTDNFLRTLIQSVENNLTDVNSPIFRELTKFDEFWSNRIISKQRQSQTQRQDESEMANWFIQTQKQRTSAIKKLVESTPTRSEFRDKLREYRLQTPSFRQDYLATQMTNIPLENETTSAARLQQLLTDTIITSRARHPLRPESYLTLKYPKELLETVTFKDIQNYFYQGQYGEDDSDLLDFYRMLTLTLNFLERVHNMVDQLAMTTRTAYLKQTRLKLSSVMRDHYDFEYRQMLKQSIITQYQENTPYHLPYVANQIHSGIPVRGQRKLLLCEIFFLTKIIPADAGDDYVVLYAGAADGSHHRVLSELFPRVKFILFDPAFGDIRQNTPNADIFHTKHTFYTSDSFGNEQSPELDSSRIDFQNQTQYHIFPAYFTPNVVNGLLQLTGQKKLLFMSDLRVIPETDQGELAIQQQIYDDNYLQYQIIDRLNQSGRLEAAMVKFRFPYKEFITKIKPKQIAKNSYLLPNHYFNGEIYVQPYAPASTTESRLIISKEVLQSRNPIIAYNDELYEQFFSYVNNVVRRSMKFYTPALTSNYHIMYDLSSKYDHLLELLILNSYVCQYQQTDINENKIHHLSLIWNLLEKIEKNPTMNNLK